jgi:c-di-GMP-binding flagellar brake protein YcgR
MAFPTKELRHFPRVKISSALRYQVRGRPEFDNAIIDNISEGGIAFNNEKFIAPHTPVMLEFSLLSRMLYPIGRISWAMSVPHSDKYRLGIEFIEMEPPEKSFLTEYINLQKEQH